MATADNYISSEQLVEFVNSLPAVIIDYDVRTMSEKDFDYNTDLAEVEQFEIEIYVYCTKSDDEADYQWWEEGVSELAEAAGIDSGNAQFTIYPDDENNPNLSD